MSNRTAAILHSAFFWLNTFFLGASCSENHAVPIVTNALIMVCNGFFAYYRFSKMCSA